MCIRTSFAPRALVGPRLKVAAVLVGAITAGIASWLVLERNPIRVSTMPAAQADGPWITTVDGLTALAATRGSAVYPAGARPGSVYEVTQAANGYVYVRYLPSGTAPDDPRPDFLTIATHPRANAYGDIQAASRRSATEALRLVKAGGRRGIRPIAAGSREPAR